MDNNKQSRTFYKVMRNTNNKLKKRYIEIQSFKKYLKPRLPIYFVFDLIVQQYIVYIKVWITELLLCQKTESAINLTPPGDEIQHSILD